VKVRLDQYKVVRSENGKETLVDAQSIKPGDVIEYRASYTNQDDKPVRGLQAILPIPEGMQYLPNTARPGPGKALAATVTGAYAPEPLTRQVRVNGHAQVEPVPYVQYRSLKWDLGQLAQARRKLCRRVRNLSRSMPHFPPFWAACPHPSK